MRRVLWVILVMIFVGCSESNEETNESGTSTRSSSDAKELALRSRINGEWRQINQNCDDQGRNCYALTDEIQWTFQENDVVWGRFTHPVRISNDTLYIAGIPYRIAKKSKDTLLFHAISTNDYMQLVRN